MHLMHVLELRNRYGWVPRRNEQIQKEVYKKEPITLKKLGRMNEAKDNCGEV